MWFTLVIIALVHGGSSIHTSSLPTTNTNHASVTVAKSSTKTDAASNVSRSQTQSKSTKTGDQTSSSSKQKFEVQFHGLTALDTSDALKILRENGLSEKSLLGDEELLRCASVMTEALKSKGYFSARVDVSTKGRTINFFVSEGTRSAIFRIQFAGNQAFSSEELGAKFKGCLDSYHPSGYDRELSDYCRHQTLNFLRSRGYLQAMMESSVSVSDAGVELAFKVNEGKLFRLGKIRMTGVHAFEPDDLRSRLPIHEGEIALGEPIAKWVLRILRMLMVSEATSNTQRNPFRPFERELWTLRLMSKRETGFPFRQFRS